MSATVSIKVVDRGATDAIPQVLLHITPRKLAAAAAPRCRELTRNHLKRNPRNRHGWPSTGFWEQAARATRYEIAETGFVIVVDKVGVRQRWLGGTIAPVSKKALTIPISPLSHGKTAADFPGSFVLRTRKGAYIVMNGNEGVNGGKALKPEARRKRGQIALRASLIFLFKLVAGEVVQGPNPSVMPDMDEYRGVVRDVAIAKLAQIKAGVKS